MLPDAKHDELIVKVPEKSMTGFENAQLPMANTPLLVMVIGHANIPDGFPPALVNIQLPSIVDC
jgi:hypothetical protein